MKKLVISAMLAVSLAAHAETNFLINTHLLGGYANGMSFDKNFLIMYIMGVSDVMEGIKSCVPTSTDGQTMYNTVTIYANNRSLIPSAPAASTVIQALALRYPCKKLPAL